MRTEESKSTHHNLEEYRIRASRLLKELRGPETTSALRAARRFQTLPAWADQKLAQIRAAGKGMQRKHALAVIAKEAGYRDWVHLKAAMATNTAPEFDTTRLFPPRAAVFLNLWFAGYEQARQALNGVPGRFLFPYRRQFVVCEGALLDELGLDTTDADWERIGRDWVKPGDDAARTRLAARLHRALTSAPRRVPVTSPGTRASRGRGSRSGS